MFYKKIIGTLTLLVFSVGIVITAYSFVSAGASPDNNIIFDGVVSAKSSDSITLLTSDSEVTQILIDANTVFAEALIFEDVETDDHLKINATVSGSGFIAKTIKRISSGSGYGH